MALRESIRTNNRGVLVAIEKQEIPIIAGKVLSRNVPKRKIKEG